MRLNSLLSDSFFVARAFPIIEKNKKNSEKIWRIF